MHATPTDTADVRPAPAHQRTLSGITPSGSLTLGNYLGALRRFVVGQDSTPGSRDSYYFIADLHALTMPHDPQYQRDLTLETAGLYLAAGLDPLRCTVFVQSQVRAHVELSYLLESTAYVGELSRMIQFKEKGGRPGTRASLFTYPCLMAADILLYDTHAVPVGSDQSQHVELARDVATRFNQTYGDTFVIPRFVPPTTAARLGDLSDPSRKMSKSAAPTASGVIRMLDAPEMIARKIGKAVTDSDNVVRYDPAGKPGVSNLLDIVATIVGTTPEAIAGQCPSYGALKRSCTEAVVAMLEPIQHRYAALVADRASLLATLVEGADRARVQADLVVGRAKRAMGLLC